MYYSNILVLIVIFLCMYRGDFCAYSCIWGKQPAFLVLFCPYPHFHHVYKNMFVFSIIVKFVLQQCYMYFPYQVDTFAWRRLEFLSAMIIHVVYIFNFFTSFQRKCVIFSTFSLLKKSQTFRKIWENVHKSLMSRFLPFLGQRKNSNFLSKM